MSDCLLKLWTPNINTNKHQCKQANGRMRNTLKLCHKHKLVLSWKHQGNDQAILNRISIIFNSFSLIWEQRGHFVGWRWMASHLILLTIHTMQTKLQNIWAFIDIDHSLLSVPLTLNGKKMKEIQIKRMSANHLRRQISFSHQWMVIGRVQTYTVVCVNTPPQRVGMQIIRQPLQHGIRILHRAAWWPHTHPPYTRAHPHTSLLCRLHAECEKKTYKKKKKKQKTWNHGVAK